MDAQQIEAIAREARTYPQFVEQYLDGTLLLPRTSARISNAIAAMGGEELDVEAMVDALVLSCKACAYPTSQVATLRAMADLGPCTSGDVARVLGVHASTASNTLQLLAGKRLVVRGQRRQGGGRIFTLNRDWLAQRAETEAVLVGALRRYPGRAA